MYSGDTWRHIKYFNKHTLRNKETISAKKKRGYKKGTPGFNIKKVP
jgi:hypothetical protein